MPLSTQDVIKLSQRGTLSTGQVQNLANPTTQRQAVEAPETLQAPNRNSFVDQNSYNAAQQKFNSTGNWGTPAPTGAITPASMAPATAIIPVTAPPITTPSTPALVPPPVDTTTPVPLKQESDIFKQLQELTGATNTLGSEDAFKTQQETANKIQEKQGVVNTLKNQFDAITSQAEGLKLQAQQDIQNQQLAAQQGGANVTKGGLAPEQRAMQTRNNQQLLSLGIQQHSIAAQHALASGDLATALSLVDRAVKMEYQPKKDALDAQRANIELALKDPTLTLAQQKRANDLLKQNAIETKATAAKEKDAETMQGLILQAQQNGAPIALTNQALKDGTLFGAAQILSGWTAKETSASIQEFNFAKKNGYEGSYSEYQNDDANRKAVVARASQQGLPYQVVTQIDKLSSGYDTSPITKNYNDVQNKKQSVDAIMTSGIKGPADLALVFEFMKALDPTSVVRESEYDSASKSGNIFSGAYARFNGYLTAGGGMLPPEVRKDFQSIINIKYQSATKQFENLRSETARKINIKTGSSDGLDYLTDYTGGIAPTVDQTPPQKVDLGAWISQPNYNEDIRLAKEAIANGADPVAIKARLQTKYKDVQI